MLDIKKFVWILVLLLLVGFVSEMVVAKDVFGKDKMFSYDGSFKFLKEGKAKLTKDGVNGDCFEIGGEFYCFKVSGDYDFYFVEVDEGVKFGWQLNGVFADEVEIVTNFDLATAVNIDWSDFDDSGVEYEFEGNKVKIKNANVVGGWFDPVITTASASYSTYNDFIMESSNGTLYVVHYASYYAKTMVHKSVDNGSTWVNTANASDFAQGVECVIDENDVLHCVGRSGGGYQQFYYIQYNTSSDSVLRGVNVYSGTHGGDEPDFGDIALLDDGTLVVAWLQEYDNDNVIATSFCDNFCYGAEAWDGRSITYRVDTENFRVPKLASNGTDVLLVAYHRNVEYLVYGFYDGVSWSTLANVTLYNDSGVYVYDGTGYDTVFKDDKWWLFYNEEGTDNDAELIYVTYDDVGGWGDWSVLYGGAGVDCAGSSATVDEDNVYLLFNNGVDNCIGYMYYSSLLEEWSGVGCLNITDGTSASFGYQYGYEDWGLHIVYLNTTNNNLSYFNLSAEFDGDVYVTYGQSLNTTLVETATDVASLNLTWNSSEVNITNTNATFYWNGTAQTTVRINESFFASNISVGLIGNESIDTYWYWNYTVNGTNVTEYNTTVVTQEIEEMVLYNSSGTAILGFSILNESDLSSATATSFVVNCDVWYSDESLNRSYTLNYSAGSSFVVYKNPAGFNLTANCEIFYTGAGFNDRTSYRDGLNLTDVQVNYSLYLESENTAFLVTYQDENYLYVPDVVIDVWRWYPSLGSWVSVEQGTTDFNGMTVVHLITETVDYRFLVWDGVELIYTSPDYRALCLDIPCQINLRASQSLDTNQSVYGNISYTYDVDEDNRQVDFEWSTHDGSTTTFNMSIFMDDGYDNVSAYNGSLTSSGGSLTGTVPVGFANTTYSVFIWRDGVLFGTDSFTLAPSPDEVFGTTGLILSGLLFLALGLMVLGSGIAVVVFSILGLVVAGMLVMFSGGSVFGLSSFFIWLIVAGGILVWKISQRSVS